VLTNLKEYSKLKNKWNKDWKKQIIDIILFGSFVKGKIAPNDIDICLIFREEINLSIVKQIEMLLGEKYHVSMLTADNFFGEVHSLSRTIFLEGISLISKKRIAESYGLEPKLLYTYDLYSEPASKKVRFVYLLRGRNNQEGLVIKWKGEFISNNAFLVPIDKDKEVQSVFEVWKVRYKRKKFLLMN